MIESQDVLGFIDGDESEPSKEIESDGRKKVPNPGLQAWTQTDRIVKAWITSTLSEDVLGLAVGLKIAKEVWDTSLNSFAPDLQTSEFDLIQKLQYLSKDG